MTRHFIILSSAYSLGKRIALDYCYKEMSEIKQAQKGIEFIKDKCGDDVPISVHSIETEEPGWDKLVEYDNYFKNVKVVKTKEEFVEIVLKDRHLLGIDVAKYILSRVPCTHLKLEKLTYMCYADYLCKTKEKLFEDKIYSYELGPVIESVYKHFKRSGSDTIEDDTETFDRTEYELPIRSRILAAHKGFEKLLSIDETLEKYSHFTATQLVNLTHRQLSPWQKAGYGNIENQLIEDNIILNYHKNEEV